MVLLLLELDLRSRGQSRLFKLLQEVIYHLLFDLLYGGLDPPLPELDTLELLHQAGLHEVRHLVLADPVTVDSDQTCQSCLEKGLAPVLPQPQAFIRNF